jgi:hypothetical protein
MKIYLLPLKSALDLLSNSFKMNEVVRLSALCCLNLVDGSLFSQQHSEFLQPHQTHHLQYIRIETQYHFLQQHLH